MRGFKLEGETPESSGMMRRAITAPVPVMNRKLSVEDDRVAPLFVVRSFLAPGCAIHVTSDPRDETIWPLSDFFEHGESSPESEECMPVTEALGSFCQQTASDGVQKRCARRSDNTRVYP